MLPRKHRFSELEVDTACWQVWAFSITNQQREKGITTAKGERFLLTGKLDCCYTVE